MINHTLSKSDIRENRLDEVLSMKRYGDQTRGNIKISSNRYGTFNTTYIILDKSIELGDIVILKNQHLKYNKSWGGKADHTVTQKIDEIWAMGQKDSDILKNCYPIKFIEVNINNI